MSTNPILGRDVYLALAAVGWADGELDRDEADAIVRAALEEGLDLASIQEIENATTNPIDIGVVDRLHMSKSDRLYVYALATFITRLDGLVTEEEEAALAKIAESLGIPEGPRKHADLVLRELSDAAPSDRPSRFDFAALRKTLDLRLTTAQAARLSQTTD
ncbi:MAG: hypothetical protein NVS3B20_02190 [Polyangiales bacterium]